MSWYDFTEWAQPLLRWTHVFAAMLWIGQTYLFHRFERNLLRASGGDAAEIGKVWLIHGGGLYFIEKQHLGRQIPPKLLWFRWEAATTWLSGVALLVLTYYDAGLLVEPDRSESVALTVGIGSIVAGWFLYDAMVRSPLGRHEILFAAVSFVLIVLLLPGFQLVMSSRAAFIHVGAVLGTIMAANVWLRIIPAQRKMIAAAQEGRSLEAALSASGPLRSKHNSYIVMPLVFIMISNHYPVTSYGHSASWAVLAIMMLIGFAAARILRGF